MTKKPHSKLFSIFTRFFVAAIRVQRDLICLLENDLRWLSNVVEKKVLTKYYNVSFYWIINSPSDYSFFYTLYATKKACSESRESENRKYQTGFRYRSLSSLSQYVQIHAILFALLHLVYLYLVYLVHILIWFSLSSSFFSFDDKL